MLVLISALVCWCWLALFLVLVSVLVLELLFMLVFMVVVVVAAVADADALEVGKKAHCGAIAGLYWATPLSASGIDTVVKRGKDAIAFPPHQWTVGLRVQWLWWVRAFVAIEETSTYMISTT